MFTDQRTAGGDLLGRTAEEIQAANADDRDDDSVEGRQRRARELLADAHLEGLRARAYWARVGARD